MLVGFMSLPPEFAQRIGFIPGVKGSHEAPPIPIEQSPELAPDGKGFIIVSHPFDTADPTRYLGALPDGLSAQSLDVNQENTSLMDYAISNPAHKKLVVETFNFARNPQSNKDAQARGKKLTESGYSIAIRKYPERVVLIGARKADSNPIPKPTEAVELELT